MAKLTVGREIDRYIAQCEKLKFRVPEIAGRAIYEGAKVAVNQVRSNIVGLPVSENTSGRHGRRNPTAEEKQAMLDGLGIAKKRNDGGFINVKIGFDGYDGHETDKYPQGHPISMIARSVESGTTFMTRNPFMARAIKSSKAAAIEAMQAEIDKQAQEIFD